MIGLIGGVSPYATTHIYEAICKKYREKTSDFPEIFIYSILMPHSVEYSFISNKPTEKDIEFIKLQLEKACLFFKNSNINTVAICCNTLSVLFEEIARKYNIKSITPVNETKKFLYTHKISDYVVLATGYSVKNKLYGDAIYLTQIEQDYLNDYIDRKLTKTAIDNDLSKLIKDLKDKSLNFVLGCTDIDKNDFINTDNVNIINSIDCFVMACMENI